MGLVVAATTGLIIWLVLWAVGAKAIDAFFVPLVIVLVTLVVRITVKHLSRESA